MRFLCDVHIAYKLVKHINSLGYEAIHVNNILDKWFTSDAKISEYADENDLILISKDSDFRDSFYLNNSPKKLIKINLGNISNLELLNIFSSHISEIEKVNQNSVFIIEIDKQSIYFNLPE